MIREAIRKWLGFKNEVVIPVKYFSSVYNNTPLEFTGDWIDVRACEGVQYFNNSTKKWVESELKMDEDGKLFVDLYPEELVKVPLGFALQLPSNHEAILKVRSSTSKNTGLILATSGVIDEGYSGPNDQWFGVYYSTRQERLYIGERVSQFRIQEKQPAIKFNTVLELSGKDRGGHGSTGRY